MEVGDLVKDPHSFLKGIVIDEGLKMNMLEIPELHYMVYWFQPVGEMKLHRRRAWRLVEDLEMVSESR